VVSHGKVPKKKQNQWFVTFIENNSLLPILWFLWQRW
jgi:hypothetical protein